MTINRNYSAWDQPEDLKLRQNVSTINLRKKNYNACGMILNADRNEMIVDNGDTHSIIFGATGSMKTRRFIMPMAFTMIKAGESFVVTDPKGEIFTRTAGLANEYGYEIKVINLRNPELSDHWNPLLDLYDLYINEDVNNLKKEASEIIDVISNKLENQIDPFWVEAAKDYLLGVMFLYFETNERENISFSNLARFAGSNNTKLYGSLLKRISEHNVYGGKIKASFVDVDRTFACIVNEARTFLSDFDNNSVIERVTSKSDIDFENIGKKKTAFYLVIPDETNSLDFLVTLLVNKCYSSLIEAAQKCPGNKLPCRVNFLLDEFCNIPKIEKIPSMVTAARSRNIRFFFVCQGLNQLQSIYKNNADSIVGNCSNIVFLSSAEMELLAYISQMCGTRKRYDGQIEPLISPYGLQGLQPKKGEYLVKSLYQAPVKATAPDIDEYTCFGRRTEYTHHKSTVETNRNFVSINDIIENAKYDSNKKSRLHRPFYGDISDHLYLDNYKIPFSTHYLETKEKMKLKNYSDVISYFENIEKGEEKDK